MSKRLFRRVSKGDKTTENEDDNTRLITERSRQVGSLLRQFGNDGGVVKRRIPTPRRKTPEQTLQLPTLRKVKRPSIPTRSSFRRIINEPEGEDRLPSPTGTEEDNTGVFTEEAQQYQTPPESPLEDSARQQNIDDLASTRGSKMWSSEGMQPIQAEEPKRRSYSTNVSQHSSLSRASKKPQQRTSVNKGQGQLISVPEEELLASNDADFVENVEEEEELYRTGPYVNQANNSKRSSMNRSENYNLSKPRSPDVTSYNIADETRVARSRQSTIFSSGPSWRDTAEMTDSRRRSSPHPRLISKRNTDGSDKKDEHSPLLTSAVNNRRSSHNEESVGGRQKSRQASHGVASRVTNIKPQSIKEGLSRKRYTASIPSLGPVRYESPGLNESPTEKESRYSSWVPRTSKYKRSPTEKMGGVRVTNSVLLRVLGEKEKEFHDLVAAGNVHAVHRFLVDHPDFDTNCVGYQKTSPLHVAIKEKNEEMVLLLLDQKGVQVCDVVLFAVKAGDLHMLTTVLHCLERTHPGLEFAPCPDSAEFADDVTPFMLAAREGKFEMVDLLLRRGHRMPDIHHPYCVCSECVSNLSRFDRLKYSTMKLNVYRAVSNPTYLFQTTGDPIRRAFELTRELQAAARLFPQFHAEYQELWIELRKFTAELIGCCRNADEVELILKQPAGCEAAGKLIYPRLQLAIDLMQKEFVAHPYTQAVLEEAWIGKMSKWKVQSPIQQSLTVLPRIILLPWIAIVACCLPTSSQFQRWNYPVNKLISSFAGYLLFLLVLYFECSQNKKNQKRGPPQTGWEMIIVLFVVGFIWSSIRLCFLLGGKRFFSLMWNWFDCAMEALFVLTFIFWAAAWADVIAHDDINLPRQYWNAYDPTLISEGLLTIATIMAFCRLYMPMSLNYYLGPLQISIGKMTMDLFRFVFVYALLILAWTVALCHFYQPYEGMVQTDYSSNTNTTQVSSFVNFPSTLRTFFWAIFGMSPIESADVIIENLPSESPGEMKVNTHNFTEGIGYFAFAVFQFLAVVVVLNMLVACMANTFTKVIDNVSIEWVFGRTKIYLAYMYQSMLPPPFNLIPSLSAVASAFKWISLLGKPKSETHATCSLTHCCYINHAVEEHVDRDFPALMSQIAQRYLRAKEEQQSETEPTGAKHDHEYRQELDKIKELITILADQLIASPKSET